MKKLKWIFLSFFLLTSIAYGVGGAKFFTENFLYFGLGAGDRGIYFDYTTDGGTASIIYDDGNDEIDFNKDLTTTGGLAVGGDISTTAGGVSVTGNISTTGGAVSASGNITSTGGDVSANGVLSGNSLSVTTSGSIGTDLTVNGLLSVDAAGSPSIPWPKRTQAEIDALATTSATAVYNTTTNKLNICNGTACKGVGGGSGGGGSFVWELNGDVSPVETIINGLSVFNFDSSSNQEIYAMVVVPPEFLTGNQILLKYGKFSCASSSGNVLFRADTTLIQPGENPGVPTNVHTSVNSELSLSVANALTNIGDVDLSDGSGQINGVDVEAGDVLIIRLYRNNNLETSSASSDASFIKFSASIDFNL